MKKNGIDSKSIGRIDVGNETTSDEGKPVKTVLVRLFEDAGNRDAEGS